MSAMTVFYQECPVCGRSLRVNVKYFGRPMSCSHCEGVFIAGKNQLPRADAEQPQPTGPHSAAAASSPELTPAFLQAPLN